MGQPSTILPHGFAGLPVDRCKAVSFVRRGSGREPGYKGPAQTMFLQKQSWETKSSNQALISLSARGERGIGIRC